MSYRIAVVGALLLASCGGVTVPSDPATQEGVIVARDRSTSISDGRPTIWVKDEPDDECGIIYAIGEETDLVFRDAESVRRRAKLEDLLVGARVRVWTHAVLESCPAQATAEAVEVLGSG